MPATSDIVTSAQPGTDVKLSLAIARVQGLLDKQAKDKQPKDKQPGKLFGPPVAEKLQHLAMDESCQIAAVLSEPMVAQGLEQKFIAEEFGESIAQLVANVRRLNAYNETDLHSNQGPQQAEKVRRMLLASVEDIRAVIIRLAFRLERLKRLAHENYEIRHVLAKETLEIYTPLAHRLGLAQLKWEMEDYAFRYLEPQAYKHLAKSLEDKRIEREVYVNEFVAEFKQVLTNQGIVDCKVYGRPKHIYSIWRKMQNKQLQLQDLFDIRAVRVLVDNVSQCYLALGIIHGHWQHVPKEFDDYIASPKANGYQSLHTVIIDPQGKAIEVQIRTRLMHKYAELGLAAHWRYKEGSAADKKLEATVEGLRDLLDDTGSDHALVDQFRSELYADRVFALSPKGRVIDLPKGGTAVDFAYQVHTDIGHRCRGAKVNGQIVNLRTPLKNGDQVEILTGKELKPSRDWLSKELGFLASARARSKVRGWFNQQHHERQLEEGKELLERELKRLNRSQVNLEKLTRHLRFDKHSDLYIAIGRTEVTTQQIASAVEALEKPQQKSQKTPAKVGTQSKSTGSDIYVAGVGNLLLQIARCCKPVPQDPISGFITKGAGVSVHRQDCHNLLRLQQNTPERVIEVFWKTDMQGHYNADIRIAGIARDKLFKDIVAVVNDTGVEMTAINSEANNGEAKAHDGLQQIKLGVRVQNIDQLSSLISKLHQITGVDEVQRIG